MTRSYRIDRMLLLTLRDNLAGRPWAPSQVQIRDMRRSCLEEAVNAIAPAIGPVTPPSTIQALIAGVLADLKPLGMDAENELPGCHLLEYVEAELRQIVDDLVDRGQPEPASGGSGELQRLAVLGAMVDGGHPEPTSCGPGELRRLAILGALTVLGEQRRSNSEVDGKDGEASHVHVQPAKPAPGGPPSHPRSIYDTAAADAVREFMKTNKLGRGAFAEAVGINVQTLGTVLDKSRASPRTWADVMTLVKDPRLLKQKAVSPPHRGPSRNPRQITA